MCCEACVCQAARRCCRPRRSGISVTAQRTATASSYLSRLGDLIVGRRSAFATAVLIASETPVKKEINETESQTIMFIACVCVATLASRL